VTDQTGTAVRYLSDADFTLYVGDVRDVLAQLGDESVHCVVTSPPYWGLRDYSVEGQLGLESTPEQYVENMVGVFREVRRVLRRDGTLWLNIGDSYASDTKGSGGLAPSPTLGIDAAGKSRMSEANRLRANRRAAYEPRRVQHGLKQKDLCGIPWRLAFALQQDGWYLRAEIIWAKPNPMPESVTDRPTKAHEQVFLLTRSARYFYDADAVRESAEYGRRDWGDGRIDYDGGTTGVRRKVTTSGGGAKIAVQDTTLDGSTGEAPRGPDGRRQTHVKAREGSLQHRDGDRWPNGPNRNLRSVWEIATEPFPQAHFATYPQALVERCIKAGTSEHGCCPECGAPWERETEKEEAPPNKYAGRYQKPVAEFMQRRGSGGNVDLPRGEYIGPKVTTLGWRPTCACIHSVQRGPNPVSFPFPSVPCTVFDPFIGSGTTALVARRLGRKCVGIELSPDYAQICFERTRQLSLLAEATV
jgi:DNA modification methylase